MQELHKTKWINQAGSVYWEALANTALCRQTSSSSCRSSKQDIDKEDKLHKAEKPSA